MKNDFTLAFNEIMDSRALSREVVLEAIEQALVTAYKRDTNITARQAVEANIDEEGQPHIYVEKEVVDDVISELTEVLLADAQALHGPDVELGDMVMMPVTSTSSNFGRIAAQTAKQVILQRIREAEREALYEEFIEREGDLVTGTVQSVSKNLITLSLGRAEAIMPSKHQIRDERYRQHDKVRVYVVEVNKSSRGPQIIVSRAHKDMLRRLLEYEVPEIYNGQVEIKNIAREPGERSKVAVYAVQEGIDPVGACVGMRGMRIQNIIKELNNEKIDVIEWDPEPIRYIAKALSPARVSGVFLAEALDQPRTATVVVPDDQLSLAIGKAGQNARLAAKLTGWRIDIKSVTETALENIEHIDEEPLLALQTSEPELIAEALRIVEKKRNNRPIMPEEFTTLTQFVNLSERAKMEVVQQVYQERRSRLDSVRDLVPAGAFHMSLDVLELAEDINDALRGIDNVGELMVRVLADEPSLVKLLAANGADDDAIDAIHYALDDLVIPELEAQTADEEAEAEEAIEEPADVETAEEAAEVEAEAVVDEEAEPTDEHERPVVYAAEGITDGSEEMEEFEDEDDDILTPEMWPDEAQAHESRKKKDKSKEHSDTFEEDWDEIEEVTDKKAKKKKRRKVHLVYDDELGEVVPKRRRKGSRRRDEFDEYDF